MKVKIMSLGPLGTNCYILYQHKQALIVDPGGDALEVISFLKSEEVVPTAILLTHAHFDHIGAVEKLRSHYSIDVYLHEDESKWLSDPTLNGSARLIGEEVVTKDPDFNLIPGKMTIGDFSFEVIHTPGHSPGSVSFIFHNYSFVISGDVLFLRGIGRTDLLGGDFEQLEASIKGKLYQLPDSFTVLPGHGPKTSIKEEKMKNPFIS